LWKSLYFKERWEIEEDIMFEFENRVSQMQIQFDIQFRRICHARINNLPTFPDDADSAQSAQSDSDHPAAMDPARIRLYNAFFHSFLFGPNTSRAETLNLLDNITRFEIGPYFRNVACAINSNGSIRNYVNWYYIFLNRNTLENNWRTGLARRYLVYDASEAAIPEDRRSIYCVHFDHNTLAAGCRDNLIRLWNMQKLVYIGSLVGHEGSVLCLQLDAKRGILVSGSSDSTVKIWDLRRGVVHQTLRKHSANVLGLYFDDRYIATCSKDKTVRIWGICDDITETIPVDSNHPELGNVPVESSLPRFVCVQVLTGHRAAVNSVQFKGNLIVTASGDRTARFWCMHTGNIIRTIPAHPRGIVPISMTGNYIVTGSSDCLIKVWSINTGDIVRILQGHNSVIRTLHATFSTIISGDYDGKLRIWDINSDRVSQFPQCHESK
jgi:F-box and WD-40 domain protein 1/11